MSPKCPFVRFAGHTCASFAHKVASACAHFSAVLKACQVTCKLQREQANASKCGNHSPLTMSATTHMPGTIGTSDSAMPLVQALDVSAVAAGAAVIQARQKRADRHVGNSSPTGNVPGNHTKPATDVTAKALSKTTIIATTAPKKCADGRADDPTALTVSGLVFESCEAADELYSFWKDGNSNDTSRPLCRDALYGVSVRARCPVMCGVCEENACSVEPARCRDDDAAFRETFAFSHDTFGKYETCREAAANEPNFCQQWQRLVEEYDTFAEACTQTGLLGLTDFYTDTVMRACQQSCGPTHHCKHKVRDLEWQTPDINANSVCDEDCECETVLCYGDSKASFSQIYPRRTCPSRRVHYALVYVAVLIVD